MPVRPPVVKTLPAPIALLECAEMPSDVLEMPLQSTRLTLALGLFDRAAALLSAVRDLAAQQLDLDGLRILTADQSLDGPGLFDEMRLMRQGSIVVRYDPVRTPDVLRGLCSLVCVRRGDVCGSELTLPPSFTHVGERQALRLERHLRAGGSIMMVPVAGVGDQRTICSILLHYVSDGVQTHEIRCRRIAAPA